jgi:hypothetical protein
MHAKVLAIQDVSNAKHGYTREDDPKCFRLKIETKRV